MNYNIAEQKSQHCSEDDNMKKDKRIKTCGNPNCVNHSNKRHFEAGVMLKNGIDFAELMLNMQIGAIKTEIDRSKYKINLAESLLEQGPHTELIDRNWLLQEIKRIELMEKEKEEEIK